MTYEEALEIINTVGEYGFKNGVNMKRVIVPFNPIYFSEFNNDLMIKYLSKEDVKHYAKDNQYAIWEYSIRLIKGESFKL
jgi:hypothetical protein